MDKNQKATINDLVITQAGENKGFLEQVKQTLLIVQEIHYTFVLLVGKYEKGEESQKELLQQAEDLLKVANGSLDDLRTLKEEFNNEAKEALKTIQLLSAEVTQEKEAMQNTTEEFKESLENFIREKNEYKNTLLSTELLLENLTTSQEVLTQSLQELQEKIVKSKEELGAFEIDFKKRLQTLSASLDNSENSLANAISEAKTSITEEAQRLKEQLQGILEQIKQEGADISINAYDDTELRERIEVLENTENPTYDDTELRGRIEVLENQENTTLEMSAEFLSPVIQNTSNFLFLSNELLKAGVIHT